VHVLSRAKSFRLCINTQTPLIRFKLSYPELLEKYGTLSEPIDLPSLKEGVDYDPSPGGVTAMVFPSVKKLMQLGIVERPHWISLAPNGPNRFEYDGIQFQNIWLDQEQLVRYANFKEGIWNEIHGLGRAKFLPLEYEAYVNYNWLCSKLMLSMLSDTDLFWIHDFQQLHVGNLIGPSAPAIFRWHLPFNLSSVSDRLKTLVMKNIEGFDSIIVSSRRDLQGLIQSGYRGSAYAIYPYLDETVWTKPSENSVASVRSKFNLSKSDRYILVVGRMDQVKSQDIAIRALSRLRRKFPDVRLLLIGNGSFTGSTTGGLGHPKATRWKVFLEETTRELKLNDSVAFLGHVNHEDLNAIYSIVDAVIVPSKVEGFNLTAVEGWIHKKPCLVSDGAGVSELVHADVNGFTFPSSNDLALSEKLELVLGSPEAAQRMGENGFMMSKQCYVDSAVEKLRQVFEETSAAYSGVPKGK
jgi:glycosyltransferase involved in cell wall biosynthesis